MPNKNLELETTLNEVCRVLPGLQATERRKSIKDDLLCLFLGSHINKSQSIEAGKLILDGIRANPNLNWYVINKLYPYFGLVIRIKRAPQNSATEINRIMPKRNVTWSSGTSCGKFKYIGVEYEFVGRGGNVTALVELLSAMSVQSGIL